MLISAEQHQHHCSDGMYRWLINCIFFFFFAFIFQWRFTCAEFTKSKPKRLSNKSHSSLIYFQKERGREREWVFKSLILAYTFKNPYLKWICEQSRFNKPSLEMWAHSRLQLLTIKSFILHFAHPAALHKLQRFNVRYGDEMVSNKYGSLVLVCVLCLRVCSNVIPLQFHYLLAMSYKNGKYAFVTQSLRLEIKMCVGMWSW